MEKKIVVILLSMLFTFWVNCLDAQTLYPQPAVNQSYIPPAPEAQSFENYGNNPTALYLGLPAIQIPIFKIQCGSLSLPISLSYNYNGLHPLEDASWVGLGWNLNAGGVITRIVEGNPDSTQNSGYNYDQYNIVDTLFAPYDYNNFLQNAYDNNLTYLNKAYDLAPDIFDCEFYNGSGKFFWYKEKAYQLDYDKQLAFSWPSQNGNITVTTSDGTKYIFGAKDTTTYNLYGGTTNTPRSYFSAWHLSMVISADSKDTISLTYAPYQWKQCTLIPYVSSYVVSDSTQANLGSDTTSFNLNPVVITQVLQSIQCRTSRVSFVPGGRTDMGTDMPSLDEIDVIDSLTGNTVKKVKMSYEYFGIGGGGEVVYERLKLKRLNTINTLLSSDSLTYSFKYAHEYDSFPAKTTYGLDYWGFYNGQDTNKTLLPTNYSSLYSPVPHDSLGMDGGNRSPDITYCSYGALDTLVYPTGGYSAFQYEQNMYSKSGTNTAGPGIRLSGVKNYNNNASSPVLQTSYNYLLDDGITSSGVLGNPPIYYGYPFAVYDGTNTYNFTNYSTFLNSPGVGNSASLFHYQKVTEDVVSSNETHRSDHYFSMLSGVFLDVRQTKQIDYINDINTSIFKPVRKTTTTYHTVTDTSFYAVFPYISEESYDAHSHPITYTYTYGFGYNTWSTYWNFPDSGQTIEYDSNGDSLVSTVYFTFNPTTRNLASIQKTTSDGQTLIQKFKYPEDYTSTLTGNMVNSKVLGPTIETETWLKQDASDSLLINGVVTLYDQTTFKPTSTYAIETTSPIQSLNNETKSGGLYSSFLCDSRYILKGTTQYDSNDNPYIVTKANDVDVSYIWDYHHSIPVAKVENASQSDIAYTSFEADGDGNWSYSGTTSTDTTSPTGTRCYNLGQTGGSISKSGLQSGNTYIVSYWLKNNTTGLSITGTESGYPIKGKTIDNWTFFEHKITGQSSITVSGSGTLYIDELRLYPYTAQMTTTTFFPLIGKSSQCDQDNRVTYYKYDGFNRLNTVLDQDHNIVRTIQRHFYNETSE